MAQNIQLTVHDTEKQEIPHMWRDEFSIFALNDIMIHHLIK